MVWKTDPLAQMPVALLNARYHFHKLSHTSCQYFVMQRGGNCGLPPFPTYLPIVNG